MKTRSQANENKSNDNRNNEDKSNESKSNENKSNSNKSNSNNINENKRKRPSNDDSSEGNDRSEPKPKPKPRLTTPDLEFDFDRSQLRDPRPTPGRKARPRHDNFEIERDEALKARLENEFTIPKPEKPKGRLNAMIKSELFEKEGMMNPAASFHDLYRCHKKGPRGSPTYDDAGFQLDYNKVCEWKQPQTYNKGKMVRGMEKAVEARQSKEEQIASLFFTNGSNEETRNLHVINHVQDHVSKDLGIPFHQIDAAKVKEWREKFEPLDYETWWKKPNEVEDKRMLKMIMGASLRKCL